MWDKLLHFFYDHRWTYVVDYDKDTAEVQWLTCNLKLKDYMDSL